MNLDAAKIKPAEYTLAVSFIDDDDGDDDSAAPTYDTPSDGSTPYEGCLATVIAVGPKVVGIKAGMIVVTGPYARAGLKIGDRCTLISSYDVKATVQSPA